MVRFLCIGDPHIKVSSMARSEAMIESIIQIAQELQPDFIVDLGDTLDTHERIHINALAKAVDMLKRLAQIAPVYVLIGNHDRANANDFLSPIHPFLALEGYPNIIVSGDVIWREIDGQLFVFVPYVPPGRFQDALARCPEWPKATAIFAHQEFRGCKMGVVASTVGDVWPSNYPFVVCGHIHGYQWLQSNLCYVGTPIQNDFGEDENKAIILFTIQASVEPITTSTEAELGQHIIGKLSVAERRIELSVPKLLKVQLQAGDVYAYEIPPNRTVKIVISGTSAELKTIMKLPKIAEWKKRGVKVAYNDVPLPTLLNHQIKPLGERKMVSFGHLLFRSVAGTTTEALFKELFGDPLVQSPTLVIQQQQYLALQPQVNTGQQNSIVFAVVD
jgi:DNA repair exonuclease SbcCD nuclease subunit